MGPSAHDPQTDGEPAAPPSVLAPAEPRAARASRRIARAALRIALLYALFGAVWIAVVELLVLQTVTDRELLGIVRAYGNWALIAVTAAAGYWLIRRELRRRVESEDALRRREERFRALVQHSADVIFVLSPEGQVRYASPNIDTVLGLQLDNATTANVLELIHPEERMSAGRTLEELRNQPGHTITTEVRALHADGSYRSLELWGKNLLDDPHIAGIVLNARDVTERKLFEAEIQRLAYFDALTGLANRRLLRDRARQAISMAKRHGNAMALLYLDLDRFKAVNDTLGHDAGDELLKEVAQRLLRSIRDSDTLARLGGDEFAILLTEVREEEDAVIVARRVVDALQQSVWVQQHPVHIGTSVGIAVYPQDGESYEELTKHADIAMYRAKTEKSGYQFYRPELSVYTRDRLLLEEEFRHALQQSELSLAYQPVLHLPTRSVVGAEALARWSNVRRGEVPPAEFVPLAEDTGMIGTLDRWVIGAASRVDKSQNGWKGWVAVNLSPRTLNDATIVPYVAQEIEAAGIEPDRLVIEITESAAMRNPEQTADLLLELKQVGVQVALDDFGMGYSSLAYLKAFPIDILKLDKSFVRGVGAEPKDERLVEAVIRLAHGLGMLVLAEGVEHQRQLNFLMAEGCDLVQGYLIGMPTPWGRIEAAVAGATSAPGAAMATRPFPEF